MTERNLIMYYQEEKKHSVLKKVAVGVLAVVLVLAGFGVGIYSVGKSEVVKELAKKEVVYAGKILGKYGQGRVDLLTQDINFDLFWNVWDVLEKQYVSKDKINEKELFYGAVSGMVDAVGDPYTVFMDPKMAEEFAESLSGTFEGIGAEIGIRDEILTIIAPLPDTPAQKSGLQAGDKIYAIDGESTAGISIDEAVSKIRGPKDTNVILTISRDGFDEARDITITRGTIVVKSVETLLKDGETGEVKAEKTKDSDTFVIKVTNFNDDTSALFNQAVEDIIKTNPKGIILDLRNNPGGYLDTAVEMASEWIEEGVIVTEEFSAENKNEFQARGRARLKDYKTIVLVNQGSASASEIVAGALQDKGKATIVGMKTFGKGSVQTLESFSDGSSVKITVAKWLTPNGNYINEQGIKPDVEIDMTAEDYEAGKDPQMEKAIELLRGE
jgi:carboxyl-terminal processing protease